MGSCLLSCTCIPVPPSPFDVALGMVCLAQVEVEERVKRREQFGIGDKKAKLLSKKIELEQRLVKARQLQDLDEEEALVNQLEEGERELQGTTESTTATTPQPLSSRRGVNKAGTSRTPKALEDARRAAAAAAKASRGSSSQRADTFGRRDTVSETVFLGDSDEVVDESQNDASQSMQVDAPAQQEEQELLAPWELSRNTKALVSMYQPPLLHRPGEELPCFGPVSRKLVQDHSEVQLLVSWNQE